MATKIKLSASLQTSLKNTVKRLEGLKNINIVDFDQIPKNIVLERKVELKNEIIQSRTISTTFFVFSIASLLFGKYSTEQLWRVESFVVGISGFAVSFIYGIYFLSSFLKLRKLNLDPKAYAIKKIKYMLSKY